MTYQSLLALPLATLLLGAAPRGVPTTFRDLNHNGRLDSYEDPRLPVAARVDDLVNRMTLEEKVGAMLHASLPSGDPVGVGSAHYDMAAVRRMIQDHYVTSAITRLSVAPADLAEQNNAVQRLAAATRLGIPVTISTDPRNHFQSVLGASTRGGGFSLWPETLGFAALRDPARVRRFATIARQEYRAVGIHMALSPQADLASEPRWSRVTATFGSDPALVSRLAGAYVAGFQGGTTGLTRTGVATVVKHWVGYGAEPQGFDGHNYYGRVARLDNASFARHVAAFDGAFAAHTTGVMPTYPIISGVTLDGRPLEAVGAGFSRQLLTDLLRGRKRFGGLVLSDWAITNDCPTACRSPSATAPQTPAAIGTPWGVETLTAQARFAKGANAGIDQFGGVDDPAPLLAAVRSGDVPVARIDAAVRRILAPKFLMGLFENPYVDPAAAARQVGSPQAQREADLAQREAQVLIENDGGLLPIASKGRRVWLYRVDPAAARRAGFTVVADPAQAEIAIVRMDAPSERLHPYHFFGSRQNEGRLHFVDGDADYEALKRAAKVPTLVAINLDRPAILTNVRDKARALLVTFGASDAAVLDVATGRATAMGRLPFELPRSEASVARQDPAVQDDSGDPLYPLGAGLGRARHTSRP
ncbi:glycoside hydrolase family 3 N-terminal domain-containing protein [Sphingomonas paucimobilis]|uniref:glycoside hydrolase family 3 protein n=1 Tax=Sphingomonas paucimobilis TaxID=13689 RepID=UPI0028D61106|nr:glycoside hydrolase family 3 N-terminal domain-containing protein [Sphingomonas paucimobilis]